MNAQDFITYRRVTMENLVTAELHNGKFTGRYQKGDFSKHSLFNNANYKVMSKDDFSEAVKSQNYEVSVITRDELAKAMGYSDAGEMDYIINTTGECGGQF